MVVKNEMLAKIAVKETIVECEACHRLHKANEKTYFVVEGNIYVGRADSLVGNNVDSEGCVKGVTIFCKSCLIEHLEEVGR